MTVRAARPDDVAAIAALELEAFPGDAWTPEYLELAVDGSMPTIRVLVAESEPAGTAGPAPGTPAGGAGSGAEGRTIVGHAIISVVYEIAELQRIAVLLAHRRHGHATALLSETLALATRDGAERLLLEVREENSGALMFYRRAGFMEIDRRERYYRDGATGIVLALEL